MPLNLPKLGNTTLTGPALGRLALGGQIKLGGSTLATMGSGTPQPDLRGTGIGLGNGFGGGGFAQKPSGAMDYSTKIVAMFGSAIVGYWMQGEPSGTVSLDTGPKAHPGVYTAVTLAQTGIGDGRTAASFDGTTSKNVIYSAGLNTDFNNLQATIMLWAKVSGAGVWTDATVRNGIQIAADGNNYFQIARTATNNQLNIAYDAGSTVKAVTDSSLAGSLAYFHVGMTVDKAGDALKAYINGAQVGATQTALGMWAGALAATLANIGAAASTPTAVWSGTLAHVLVLNRAATAAEMAIAATVP